MNTQLKVTLVWHEVVPGKEWHAGGLERSFSVVKNDRGRFSLRARSGDLPSLVVDLFDTLDRAQAHAQTMVDVSVTPQAWQTPALFPVRVLVNSQQLADIFTTAFEGATTYWCQEARRQRGPDLHEGKNGPGPWYSHEEFYERDFCIALKYDDPKLAEGNGKGRFKLDRGAVIKGLEALAAKDPRHLGELLCDDHDRDTADSFLQYVVFGDVVFG